MSLKKIKMCKIMKIAILTWNCPFVLFVIHQHKLLSFDLGISFLDTQWKTSIWFLWSIIPWLPFAYHLSHQNWGYSRILDFHFFPIFVKFVWNITKLVVNVFYSDYGIEILSSIHLHYVLCVSKKFNCVKSWK